MHFPSLSHPVSILVQPRTFVPRALLYNDGGFDVSPDGKTLCACAEYWLPEGVNNAMELVHQEELRHEEEQRRADREVERRLSAHTSGDSRSSAVRSTVYAEVCPLLFERIRPVTVEVYPSPFLARRRLANIRPTLFLGHPNRWYRINPWDCRRPLRRVDVRRLTLHRRVTLIQFQTNCLRLPNRRRWTWQTVDFLRPRRLLPHSHQLLQVRWPVRRILCPR